MSNYKILNKSYLRNNYDKLTNKLIQVEKIFSSFELNIEKKIYLVFVSEGKIKSLNFEYRNKDHVTDVITFHPTTNDYFGQIFINIKKVNENAINWNSNNFQNLLRIIIHGTMHLFNFDHNNENYEKFISLQENILNQIV